MTLPSLFDAPPSVQPPREPRRRAGANRRRVLASSTPLATAYATRGQYVRALLQEFGAARDCERRCKTMAAKPTTSAHERFTQSELAAHHHQRQESVVLALMAMLA